MKNPKNSKTKASIINLLFNYANASFAIINGLILVPLYLSYFSVATYGSYLSSGNIVAMLGLLEGGISFVLTQKLSSSYAKKDIVEFKRILGSGLLISIFVFCLLLLIGLVLFPFISDWVKAEPNQYKNIQYAFLLSSIGAGLNILFHNLSSVFQALLKVHISGLTNLISIVCGISVTLIGLHYGLGVVAIPLGVLVKGFVGVVVLAISMIFVLKKEKIRGIQIDFLKSKDLLKSILPMFAGGVAKSVVSNSQLLIITNYINPTASAVFFITGRIYQVCDSFLAPVGSSIFSSISQIVGEGDIKVLKTRIINIFFVFNIFSVFILSLSFIFNLNFVSLLLGYNKYGGNLLSFLLCLNMFIYTRFNFLSVNLYALGIFQKTVIYDVLSGIIRLSIIFILIRFFGYLALPIADIISSILILGYFLNKLLIYKLQLKGKEVYSFLFSGLSSLIVFFFLSFIWLSFLPKIESWFVFISFALFVILVNGGIILIVYKEVWKMTFNILNKFNFIRT